MWSMPVVLTKTENENDSANQNYVAKMTLQKWCCKNDVAKWRCKMTSQTLTMLFADGEIPDYSFNFNMYPWVPFWTPFAPRSVVGGWETQPEAIKVKHAVTKTTSYRTSFLFYRQLGNNSTKSPTPKCVWFRSILAGENIKDEDSNLRSLFYLIQIILNKWKTIVN